MSLDRSNGQGGRGDQAFRDADGRGTWQEMTYGGAVSFARRYRETFCGRPAL